jgi:phenylpropionate dioxygenase-like ring-hydroxylating dioxygenase large terminal subunit
MFLRNYWYVAASDSDIGRKPFRRIIMNEPVVFYRTEDGTPIALEDRCPHRRLPLSMGKLVGDDILQCHYHGLRFDRTGACVDASEAGHRPWAGGALRCVCAPPVPASSPRRPTGAPLRRFA